LLFRGNCEKRSDEASSSQCGTIDRALLHGDC
jgi:hypothetical protein